MGVVCRFVTHPPWLHRFDGIPRRRDELIRRIILLFIGQNNLVGTEKRF
jgi:hypothetical protein